jgi:addiction module HigA family antidote
MSTKTKARVKAPERLSNPHPGRLLRKYFLEPLNMTQAQLSQATGLPQSRITELLKERRGITVDSAIRFARVLGPHPQFWIGLQADYDMREALRARGDEYDKLRLYSKPEAAAA